MNTPREKARRVTLLVSIAGHDVADAVAPYLLDFTFTDNTHGKADEVRLTLHNRDGRWSGAWKPRKGMPVQATLICSDWEAFGQTLSLPCGRFTIDEIEFSGPPDKVSIKAVSSALTSQLRDTEKTRAWENTSLQAVAAQIATENGLSLLYTGDAHRFQRIDQRRESDLGFISRLAGERAMNCKVHDGKLVLFDAETAESQRASMTLPKQGGMYSPTSYSFTDASSGTGFTSAEVAYTNPATGTTHVATARAADQSGADSKTLMLDQRVESAGEAMRLSRAQLHNANAQSMTARVECLGCPRLVAGRTVSLEGFGDFSGLYFISSATHRTGGSQGYSTALELTRGAATEDGMAKDSV